jgi:hypothetical protein
MIYRKKPVEVTAVRWDGSSNSLAEFPYSEWQNFFVSFDKRNNKHLNIKTLEGTMQASIGDWIVRGVAGEYYPVKPEIFEKTYERV